MQPDKRPEDGNTNKPSKGAPEGQFAETCYGQAPTSLNVVSAQASGAVNPWIGRRVGKYEVASVLGRGAMGLVLKARDPLIERDVAIKVLAPHLAADPTALGRFLAEAQSAGKVNHPNVIGIHEIIQEGTAYYLVLEFAAGGNLGERIAKQGRLSVGEATRALIEACHGVGAAHAAGLIHRDIKPANLMQTGTGSIKVADFGLAKAISGASRSFTQTGSIVGTPFFMSPEQCAAEPLDRRSDVYALGATYYSLLTGRNPFQDSDSVPQLMYLHCHGPIPDPRNVVPSVPEACSRIVARAMAKSPGGRYQSTEELMADLQAVLAAPSESTTIVLPSDANRPPAVPAPPGGFVGAAGSGPHDRPLPTATANEPQGLASGQAGRRAHPPWTIIGATAVVVALLVIGGLWLAGFLGRSREKDPNSGTAATTPPGEVVLGMTGPFSGPASELGREMEIGLRTYFEEVNEQGGVGGRKIRLVSLDDGYEPDRALANVDELVNKHKVFGFIGNVGTAPAEKTVPFAVEKRMVFFGGLTGAPLLRKDPPDRFVFNYRASYEEETAAIFKYFVEVKRISPQQIAVFTQQDGYGDAGMRGVTKMLRRYGADPEKVVRVGHARNTVAVDDAVQRIVQNPDVAAVIMVSTYRPAAAFIQKVKEGRKAAKSNTKLLFANVSFVGSHALAEELRQMGPEFADGVIVTQVVPHIHSQATALIRYRNLLAKHQPNARPSYISLEGYIDAMLIVEGMKRVPNELTTDSLITALESIQALDLGIGTPLTFGPSEHQASHKVWGTVLDSSGNYQVLDMD